MKQIDSLFKNIQMLVEFIRKTEVKYITGFKTNIKTIRVVGFCLVLFLFFPLQLHSGGISKEWPPFGAKLNTAG
jgi:hypothetical protein